MYRFNRRTAEPLGPPSAPGSDKPTSRCQTTPSIRTLKSYQPVIPGVPFIRWAIGFPYSPIGSLRPTKKTLFLYNMSIKTVRITIYHCAHALKKSGGGYLTAHPCYYLRGYRPSQTTTYTLSPKIRFQKTIGWFFQLCFRLLII